MSRNNLAAEWTSQQTRTDTAPTRLVFRRRSHLGQGDKHPAAPALGRGVAGPLHPDALLSTLSLVRVLGARCK